jgi:hypothetical protein
MVAAIELSYKTKDPTTVTIEQQVDSAVLLPAQSDSSSDEEQGSPNDDDDDDKEEKESPKKSNGGNKTKATNPSSRPRAVASLFHDQADEEDTTCQTHMPRSRNDEVQHHHQASFDIETFPAKKRRRLVASSEPHVWDGFVRKGARLKGFLDDALHLVAIGFQPSNDCDDDDSSSSEKRIKEAPASRQLQGDHSADIAREKTAECFILQKVSAQPTTKYEWE